MGDKPMGRKTLISPRGLITRPNKYGSLAKGALSLAKNVVMRDAGIIGSMPGLRVHSSDVHASGGVVRRIWPGTTKDLIASENSGSWILKWLTAGGAATSITIPTLYGSLGFDVARAHLTKTRNRIFVTGNNGPLAFDSEGSATPRIAGLPKPSALTMVNSTSSYDADADSMEDGKRRRYRMTFEQETTSGEGDEYILISGVSNALSIRNASGVLMDPIIRCDLPPSDTFGAGSHVKVWRTKDIDSPADPGDTFYLAKDYVITSTDVSNGYVAIRDSTKDDAIALELYTNPGQETLDGSNQPIPLADDMWTFKGYTFYLSRSVLSTVKYRVAAGAVVPPYFVSRADVIGMRSIVGNTLSGNTTITGIAAADLVGVKVGQVLDGIGITAGTKITAVGATSITVDIAPSTTASPNGSLFSKDVIQIFRNGGSVDERVIFEDTHLDISNDWVDTFASIAFAQQFLPPPLPIVYPEETALLPNGVELGGDLFIRARFLNDVVSVRATNGHNYIPPLPELNESAKEGTKDVRKNRLTISKRQQPEHIHSLSTRIIGSGECYRGIPTRDSVLLFCSDGLWKLSGADGVWSDDIADPNLIIAGRNAVDTLGDKVWAYCERGLVSINSDGVATEVSNTLIGDLLPGAKYSDTWDIHLSCDAHHNEVWLTIRGSGASETFIYNTLSGAFTTFEVDEYSSSAYSKTLKSIILGRVSANPDVYYFEEDTSNTRLGGWELAYHPLYASEPFGQKQFVDLDLVFSGLLSTLTVQLTFGGVAFNSIDIAVPVKNNESRYSAGIDINAPAVAASLLPGLIGGAGSTTNPWKFNGLSAMYDLLSEDE